jgi:hypothetical protein
VDNCLGHNHCLARLIHKAKAFFLFTEEDFESDEDEESESTFDAEDVFLSFFDVDLVRLVVDVVGSGIPSSLAILLWIPLMIVSKYIHVFFLFFFLRTRIQRFPRFGF